MISSLHPQNEIFGRMYLPRPVRAPNQPLPQEPIQDPMGVFQNLPAPPERPSRRSKADIEETKLAQEAQLRQAALVREIRNPLPVGRPSRMKAVALGERHLVRLTSSYGQDEQIGELSS